MKVLSKKTNKDGSIRMKIEYYGEYDYIIGKYYNPEMGLNMITWIYENTGERVMDVTLRTVLDIFKNEFDFEEK